MKRLIDVVNFNADASCLSSTHWLKCLRGGDKSVFCQWLNLYVRYQKPVVLGLCGATISDLASMNPEAIDFINNHRDIFEIILRPYAHDITFLRSNNAFTINLEVGRKIIEREFGYFTNYFLPPEFMITNFQVAMLAKSNTDGTFINAARFTDEIMACIPDRPYYISGLFDTKLKCLPVDNVLTLAYQSAIQLCDNTGWNNRIAAARSDLILSWRDGESSFLLPNGLSREEYWLNHELADCKRVHIGRTLIDCVSFKMELDERVATYPVHSFAAWMKELRMLWFIKRVQNVEMELMQLNSQQLTIWLQVINSDIISAVEKKSPVIKINDGNKKTDYTILRSNRGFEGEEYIQLLEHYEEPAAQNYLYESKTPHIVKLKSRIAYLEKSEILPHVLLLLH